MFVIKAGILYWEFLWKMQSCGLGWGFFWKKGKGGGGGGGGGGCQVCDPFDEHLWFLKSVLTMNILD